MKIKYVLYPLLSAFFLNASFLFAAVENLSSITGPSIITSDTITVDASSKKGLVVVFLSSKCPCSNSHLQELKALSNEFTDFNFVAIHSNLNEELGYSKNYFKKAELPFRVIQDQQGHLADRFRALKTPHAFVVTSDGSIKYQGGVSSSRDFSKADQKFLRNALNDLHNNRPVQEPEGRTLGCAITREELHVL